MILKQLKSLGYVKELNKFLEWYGSTIGDSMLLISLHSQIQMSMLILYLEVQYRIIIDCNHLKIRIYYNTMNIIKGIPYKEKDGLKVIWYHVMEHPFDNKYNIEHEAILYIFKELETFNN